MKLITLGSRVADDAIVSERKHNNELRVTGISPFSLSRKVNSALNDRVTLNIAEEKEYAIKMLTYDLNNTLSEEIKKKEYDYFFVDFIGSDSLIIEAVFKDNTKIRYTNGKLAKSHEKEILLELEKVHGAVIKKQTIDPLSWSPDHLECEIEWFAEWLLENVDQEKIIFLEAYLPYQYIINNEIINKTNYIQLGAQNTLYQKCFKLISKKIEKSKFISKVDVYTGSEKSTDNEPHRYVGAYYEYINNVIDIEFKADMISKIQINYMHQLQNMIDILELPKLLQEYKAIGNERSVVLFGTEELKRSLENNHIKVHLLIPYAIGEELDETLLMGIRDKRDELVCILPHIFHNDNLLKRLYLLGYTYPMDIIKARHDLIKLENFVGNYSDMYHNYVTVERGIVLHIHGNGNDVFVGNSNKNIFTISAGVFEQTSLILESQLLADRLSIGLNAGSNLYIGEGSSFADYDKIRAPYLADIYIGKDCMLSSKIFIYGGDGHSIYDLETEECINFNRKIIGTPKTKICLGDHVWVGYEAVILPKTSIGTGSIVGARSIINNAYPNNCIIAGTPGKIVKKDIGWTREPFMTNIYFEKELAKSGYLEFTKE